MIIRVRSKTGTERITVQEGSNFDMFQEQVKNITNVEIAFQKYFLDPIFQVPLQDITKLQHGDMIYLNYEGDVNPAKPKQQQLKDIDVKWDIAKYTKHLEDQGLVFHTQEASHCTVAKVCSSAFGSFQSGLISYGYQRYRIGFMYGVFTDDGGVRVETIYEPKQQTTENSFEIIEEEEQTHADSIAGLLGLEKVGWIVFQPGTKGKSSESESKVEIQLTSKEIVLAAKLQSDAIKNSPTSGNRFVTLKAIYSDGTVQVEPFQVTDQCIKLHQHSFLKPNPKRDKYVYTTKSVSVVEKGKGRIDTKKLSCILLVVVLPVETLDDCVFLKESNFPVENREEFPQSLDELKNHMTTFKSYPLAKSLNDFHLLLFLSKLLDMQTLPTICESIVSQNSDALEGIRVLLDSYINQ